MPNTAWGEITYPFKRATVEVWEWISNFIRDFIMDAITYPCLIYGPVSISDNTSCSKISINLESVRFNVGVLCQLTHWGRVTHICVGNLAIIGSDNGLSPGRRQAIIWSNAGILLNGPLGTNFSEISIGNQRFSFTKMHLNMSSKKWRPFCLGLNVLSCPEEGSIISGSITLPARALIRIWAAILMPRWRPAKLWTRFTNMD